MNRSRWPEMSWLDIDTHGLIISDRVVAVGRAAAAGPRRLLAALDEAYVLDLTGGHRRETIVVLDSGHAVITPLDLEEIRWLLSGRPTGGSVPPGGL